MAEHFQQRICGSMGYWHRILVYFISIFMLNSNYAVMKFTPKITVKTSTLQNLNLKKSKISQTEVTKFFSHHNSDFSLAEGADNSLITRNFGFDRIAFFNRNIIDLKFLSSSIPNKCL